MIKTLITRLFLQTGLGVTFGYMLSVAFRAGDKTGVLLMVLGAALTFWAFTR